MKMRLKNSAKAILIHNGKLLVTTYKEGRRFIIFFEVEDKELEKP
jgi:hypothetical protein